MPEKDNSNNNPSSPTTTTAAAAAAAVLDEAQQQQQQQQHHDRTDQEEERREQQQQVPPSREEEEEDVVDVVSSSTNSRMNNEKKNVQQQSISKHSNDDDNQKQQLGQQNQEQQQREEEEQQKQQPMTATTTIEAAAATATAEDVVAVAAASARDNNNKPSSSPQHQASTAEEEGKQQQHQQKQQQQIQKPKDNAASASAAAADDDGPLPSSSPSPSPRGHIRQASGASATNILQQLDITDSASISSKTTQQEQQHEQLTPRFGSRKKPMHVRKSSYGGGFGGGGSNRTATTQRQQQQQQQQDNNIPDTIMPTNSSLSQQQQQQQQTQQQQISKIMTMPELPLPKPRHPSKCPLYCVFYAEFDNKVGPKVCYQSPRGFLDQHEIDMPVEQIHNILEETFQSILMDNNNNEGVSRGQRQQGSNLQQSQQLEIAAATSSGGDDGGQNGDSNDGGGKDNNKDSSGVVVENTIFDSCSEFIITGNELTGNIINLSTHHIHVLTRPTIISDHERYERNSLLFSVGFILRRLEDPRPFRPVLSKLALALRDVELESHFLSNPITRPQIQKHLERTLITLNSKSSSECECNLVLNSTNVLNLKLFHPPKLPSPPVQEHAVPILLRRDRHMYMYDWDLAINWVLLHVDGVTNARQISKKAEIDMEMVLACLRVLLHHGVIALVDMFFFTNRYESTEKAAALLAGKDPELLQEAVDFAARRPPSFHQQHLRGSDVSPSQLSMSPGTLTNDECKGMEPKYYSSLTDRDGAGSYNFGSGSYKQHQAELTMMQARSVPSNEQQSSLSSPPRSQQRIVEETELKNVIAELYCACNRNISIGELWTNLICERGGQYSSTLRAATPSSLDWKKMFTLLEHRRMTAFGLVHGLIRRVHNFPTVVNSYFSASERKIIAESVAKLESPSSSSSSPPNGQQQSQHHPQQQRSGVGARSRQYQHGNNNNNNNHQQQPQQLLPSSKKAGDFSSHNQQKTQALKLMVAYMMDGRHCDDELVCMFEKPIQELLDMVDEDRHVVHTYAQPTNC